LPENARAGSFKRGNAEYKNSADPRHWEIQLAPGSTGLPPIFKKVLFMRDHLNINAMIDEAAAQREQERLSQSNRSNTYSPTPPSPSSSRLQQSTGYIRSG